MYKTFSNKHPAYFFFLSLISLFAVPILASIIINEEVGILFFFIIPFIVFLFIIVGIREKREMKEKLNNLFKGIKEIYSEARKGSIDKSVADKFFKDADEALAMKEDILPNPTKEEIKRMSSQITMILAMANTPAASMSEEIDKLAVLRKEGMISDLEFQSFSEQFKLSTGEKAKDIIKAIFDLYDLHKNGAMTQGNFHAGLWSLLDKLDRKT